MKIDDIEIFSGQPNFGFRPVRRLEVKCEATNALMPAPTIEEANGRLRALASKVGANAIIEAEYNSGISFTSWKSLKATGLAVVRESDEVICPSCAETVKRGAKKCRFCGEMLPESTQVSDRTISDSSPIAEAPTSSTPPASAYDEPLRNNNNPVLIIALCAFALFVLVMMISASG